MLLDANEADFGRLPPPAGDRLLRSREVLALTGLSRSQLFRLQRADGPNRFPAPIKLNGSSRMPRWPWPEVLAWINAQRQGRSPG